MGRVTLKPRHPTCPQPPRKYFDQQGLTSDEVRQAAKREKTEKTPDELAADLITGISALLSRLEKVEWFDISSDGRTHIQEAFATLDEAFTTRINSRNLA
ncbi:MAG: hypothetical protein M0009_11755 [Deltaproteobacteria bacterium]|nr:hypothetical protein [Deltaproteobacteria bacterium]